MKNVILGDNEFIEKEYFFSKDKNGYDKVILTNSRLVFVTKSRGRYTEESYPISKITAVKMEQKEGSFRAKVLGFSIVFLIIVLVFNIIAFSEMVSVKEVAITFLPIYLILSLFIWFGLGKEKVFTYFVISHMGGEQKFLVSGCHKIDEFIHSVNNSFSK